MDVIKIDALEVGSFVEIRGGGYQGFCGLYEDDGADGAALVCLSEDGVPGECVEVAYEHLFPIATSVAQRSFPAFFE